MRLSAARDSFLELIFREAKPRSAAALWHPGLGYATPMAVWFEASSTRSRPRLWT
jgi:hypothetical protein